MIEIRNIKVYENYEALRDNAFDRVHVIDAVNACSLPLFPDDEGQYQVRINFQNLPDKAAIFDSLEKAERFYYELRALLTDVNAQHGMLDHKDFE